MIAKPGTFSDTLHVIAVMSNPARFHTRIRLFKEFEDRITDAPGIALTTVELAYGEHQHHLAHPRAHNIVRVAARDELWAKENLINIGISRLPSDWKYVAWVDGDVTFTNPHWVQETIAQLQTHHVVQMFQHALDLGPRGDVHQVHLGFGYQYNQGHAMPWKTGVTPSADEGYYANAVQGMRGAYWHSGYAWAATRHAIDTMGGLLDWAIVGSGDHHMALGLIGEVEASLPANTPKGYRDAALAYQAHASHLRGDLGFVEGSILHHWHGSKKRRFYKERWAIITENGFNPVEDIRKNSHGVYQLAPGRTKLRDDLRTYFRDRNEDSVDAE